MEHNVLSTPAQQFLDAVRKTGVLATAMKCIDTSSSTAAIDISNESIITELNRLWAGLPKVKYINESTIFHKDPYTAAQKSIERGHLSQGIRIKLETPMDWEKYSKHSRNVRYKNQAWVALDAILHYDSLEEDDVMFSKAFSHIMDWINYYILDSNEDDFAWYDMAVGQRATKLAYTIRRAIEKGEDIEHIAAMIVCAEIHLCELMEEEKIAEHSNHGLFQMAGLLALVKSLPFLANSESASSFATLKIKSMLENHFSDDFLHKEHSPMYHIFMTNYLSILLDSGFMADSDFLVELARGAIEAAAWFAMPNGMILPFGDTPNIPTAERTNFRLYSSESKIVSPPGIKYFAKGGLAVHSHHSDKKGATGYLAFNGAFHSRQHKHADDFNIQLFSNGESILSDPGTFTYQYDLPERMYFESTRAHNCLEIDGLNYSRFKQDAFGNSIQSVDVLGDVVLIDAEVIRKRLVSDSIPNNQVKMSDAVDVEITHRRKIIYLPDNFMLVVDLMDSAQSHTYRQWFQINPELLVEGDESELFIRNSKRRSIARIIPLSPSESVAEIYSGVTVPHMQGWASVDGHSLEKSTSVCVKSDGKKAVLATLFDLNPSRKSTVFFNHGTGGKYLRFTIKRGKSVFEYVSRAKGAHTEITVTGPNGEYSLST